MEQDVQQSGKAESGAEAHTAVASALDALKRVDPREPRNLIPATDEDAEGQITYWERFLEKDEAASIFGDLIDYVDVAFNPERVKRGGREFVLARKTAHYGNDGTTYWYGGVRHGVIPWGRGVPGRAVQRLKARVEKSTGRKFSYALVNYYRDGKVGLGFHADDETDLVRDAPIVSISLGARRKMVFKHKTDKRRKDISLLLSSGSRVDMLPPLQRHYKHGIPVMRTVSHPRINVTFRDIRGAVQA